MAAVRNSIIGTLAMMVLYLLETYSSTVFCCLLLVVVCGDWEGEGERRKWLSWLDFEKGWLVDSREGELNYFGLSEEIKFYWIIFNFGMIASFVLIFHFAKIVASFS